MEFITEEWIQMISTTVDILDEKNVDDFIDSFKTTQPAVMMYLLTAEFELFEEEERETLFFLGVKIWYATFLKNANMPTVTEEVLLEMDEKNDKMISYFEKEDEEGFIKSVENIMAHHPQRALMTFAVVEVMEDEAVRDDVKGAMFLALKTVIESLHKVVA